MKKKSIYVRRLVERRGINCGICGEPTPESDRTIDHIIPRSRGGRPSAIINMQLAHEKCNREKSDHIITYPPDQLLYVTSRGCEITRRKKWARIIEFHGENCGICKKALDFSLLDFDPLLPVLLKSSISGTTRLEDLRLIHKSCAPVEYSKFQRAVCAMA